MSDMENNAPESLENKLENMRKSRDTFKTKAEILQITVNNYDNIIEEQRKQIDKLIAAVCDLSKAMSEYIIECDYDVDNGLIPGEVREEIVRCRDCVKWDYDSTYPKKTCFEFSNPEDGYLVATSPDGYCAWGER